jgi:hypothetical protein
VRGRADLDAYFAATYGAPSVNTITTTDLVFSEAGDMAYEVGTMESPDGPGKYLTVWTHTEAGWKIIGDTWSLDAATPADTADGG